MLFQCHKRNFLPLLSVANLGCIYVIVSIVCWYCYTLIMRTLLSFFPSRLYEQKKELILKIGHSPLVRTSLVQVPKVLVHQIRRDEDQMLSDILIVGNSRKKVCSLCFPWVCSQHRILNGICIEWLVLYHETTEVKLLSGAGCRDCISTVHQDLSSIAVNSVQQ